MTTTPRITDRARETAQPSSSSHRRWLWVAALGGLLVGAWRPGATGAAREAASPGGLPLGSIVAFGGPANAVPESDGWMLCDGRELPRSAYPEFAAVVGHAWGGAGNGSTVRLPDLRGRFLRGTTYQATNELRDPDVQSRVASAPGGQSGNEVGSLQEDAVGPHQHPLTGAADGTGPGRAAEWLRFHAAKVPDESAPPVTSTWAVQVNAGLETRPRNVYVNWIIRVR